MLAERPPPVARADMKLALPSSLSASNRLDALGGDEATGGPLSTANTSASDVSASVTDSRAKSTAATCASLDPESSMAQRSIAAVESHASCCAAVAGGDAMCVMEPDSIAALAVLLGGEPVFVALTEASP